MYTIGSHRLILIPLSLLFSIMALTVIDIIRDKQSNETMLIVLGFFIDHCSLGHSGGQLQLQLCRLVQSGCAEMKVCVGSGFRINTWLPYKCYHVCLGVAYCSLAFFQTFSEFLTQRSSFFQFISGVLLHPTEQLASPKPPAEISYRHGRRP